ncbi:hypothetical protein B0H14DRAFT_2613027 [Mycena olivaceomarginata]|nr:hypothetical protein B0H14DRAFT_2613027 [Mycena olivaceomarginata]
MDFRSQPVLRASLILTMLALASLFSQRDHHEDDNLPLNGTGMLHTIWLYHNHPELKTILEQVEHPTDENLHAAGMVKTRLKCRGCERVEADIPAHLMRSKSGDMPSTRPKLANADFSATEAIRGCVARKMAILAENGPK